MLQPDEIIHSKRKTLSISVDAHARLIVRAPLRCTAAQISAFLSEKEGWILRKQAERKGAGINFPPENLEGYVFPILGEMTTVRLVDDKKIGYDGQAHLLYIPRERSRERLKKWLKENAKRIVGKVTEEQAARMQTSYTSLSVTSARTRWGSCSAKNALRYTFRLVYCPREIIEYVVVHELAHTKHKNHAAPFWREVEKYIPDWKVRRKWLKLHGVYMEIF